MNIQKLETYIVESIGKCIQRTFGLDARKLSLSSPPENIDAEYALGCFPLAKPLRRSPAQIAQTIADTYEKPEWMDRVAAMGPYLNVKVKSSFFYETVCRQAIFEDLRFGHSTASNPQVVLVEYSSPNTNKPLHLGHIRNNVLGMCTINLLKACGHRAIPATILNDRGIHICKAMVAYSRFGDGETPESTGRKGDHFVGDYYVRFTKEVENNPELMDEARALLRLWEEEDPAIRKLWRKMNGWVYDGFQKTYHRLGSEFELEQFESDTYKLGRKIVNTGLEKGAFYKKDDGSIWIDLTDIGLDQKIVIRSDGTSIYVTQDLGVAVERFERLQLSKVIYIVGSEQIYHFKVLFEILKRLGFSWSDQCRHLSYGMVYLPEGKMKSREGKVVDADNLMDQMKQMALDVMAASAVSVDECDREETAEAVGVGAIKYFILKVNAAKDIHFDPRASLSFDGATGAYIQYTFARIKSINRKIKSGSRDLTNFDDMDFSLLDKPEELELVRILSRYPGIVKSAAEELNPSRLAVYEWNLAKAFNGFYHKHRILDSGSVALTQVRLALANATAVALQSGLRLMGIKALQKM